MQTEVEQPGATDAPRRGWLRRALLIGGPLVLFVGVLVAYLHGGRTVSTDNAYVHADKLTVSPEVAGSVIEVAVRENDAVREGQVLFRLNDESYRTALSAARAQVSAVRLDLETLRAGYAQKLAAISEAKEQVSFTERGLERTQSLSATGISTQVDLDQARHDVEAARLRVSVLEQDAASTLVALGGRADYPDEHNPRYLAAQAEVERAERNLRLTTVTAPFAGIVSNVSNLTVGKVLQAVQPAFSIVSTDRVWVEANLKETQVTFLKEGQTVTVTIDAYPGHTWTGKVAGIGPATGAEFALIPVQNASGNWIKTAQRIAVRVAIDSADAERPLRAGMSTEVEIDTGHVRTLRDLRPFASAK